MLIALLSVIVLWSEIHSAFGFLENISLWDVTSTVQGVESLEPITLGAVLIAILVLIITTQLVRNLPALLELAILQHLDLTPGTGYAITTITKYLLMLVGGLVGFSMIGIEWSKLQWLVAALGVGLGFGLQEIFANFISGLIILFEKPIRIGDTVTIRDLTGSVTRINTRATTISDWDRKEIIVPNQGVHHRTVYQLVAVRLSHPRGADGAGTRGCRYRRGHENSHCRGASLLAGHRYPGAGSVSRRPAAGDPDFRAAYFCRGDGASHAAAP